LGSNVTDEVHSGPLHLQFDRSMKLSFQGFSISSGGVLLLHRELDDAFGLIDLGVGNMVDPSTGKNGRHRLAGLLRHARYAVFQMAEAALPREVFAGVLDLINGLRGPPAAAASP